MAQTDESHQKQATMGLLDIVSDMAYHLASANPPIVLGARYDEWLKRLAQVRAEVESVRVRGEKRPAKEPT